jgi:CelD/BcsL family acetyltransferase involved in cellulose biosynthesis
MDATLVPLGDLDERDLGAWRELADRATEPNPFFDPDFVLPAARGLGEWGEVGMVRVREGGDWVACLPVRRYNRWHRLPLPCVATWRHAYCFLGTPLLASDRVDESLASALKRMEKGSRLISFTALEWTSADGSLGQTMQSPSPPRAISFDKFTRATLVRRPDGDYLKGRVKSKHRAEFRRLARRLEEKLGGELQVVSRAGESEAVETFLRLESSGWKGRAATALASDPGHALFFSEMATAFAARGALELIFLEVNGEAIAGQCDLLAGEGHFGFKIAYDERYRQFGPGRELMLRAIDRFHSSGREWMDSCADPDSGFLNQLFPNRRELMTSVFPAAGALGTAVAPAVRGTMALRNGLRG